MGKLSNLEPLLLRGVPDHCWNLEADELCLSLGGQRLGVLLLLAVRHLPVVRADHVPRYVDVDLKNKVRVSYKATRYLAKSL